MTVVTSGIVGQGNASLRPRSYIPGASPVVPNKNKAAETLPVNPTKPSTKSCANKKRGNLLTSLTSTATDTTSNFMSVTLSVLPQERTSIRLEVDALLGTGSLAGDFIAEDVVVRYNLKLLDNQRCNLLAMVLPVTSGR